MWRKIFKTGGRNFAPFFILLWPIYLLGDVSTSTILHIFGSHLVEILLFILVWTDEISYWNEFLLISLRMFFKNGAKSDSKLWSFEVLFIKPGHVYGTLRSRALNSCSGFMCSMGRKTSNIVHWAILISNLEMTFANATYWCVISETLISVVL